MDKQLQQHNLMVPGNAKKKDDNRTRGRARYGHALIDVTSTPSYWILDSSVSNYMAASKDEFSSIEESTRSPIYLGDATPTKVCGEGIVDLEGGCFTNVLHVPSVVHKSSLDISDHSFWLWKEGGVHSGRRSDY
jgi:hypothetical protein